jgi:4-hydroxy-4-methyl-2-oxoglutarate aldolase
MSTVLDPAVLEALRGFDSPTISNAIETFNLRPRVAGYVGYDIRCIFPDLPPTVAYAVTCTVDSTTEGRRSIGFDHLYALLERAPKPALVVMQDVGPDLLHSCHAGEIMATTMKRLGAIGILTDGGLRDVQQIRALGGFQLFCPGLVVSHGNPCCVRVGEPVTISGLQIRTGDLLHGDANGVVLIPADCGPDLVAAAQRIVEQEAETLRRIKSPDFTIGPIPDLKH